jgi:hypothetical protein
MTTSLRFGRLAFATVSALTACIVLASGPAMGAVREGPQARETVAAIDPALTAGRGASLGFVEQEAENADTNGTVIGFDPSATASLTPPRAAASTRRWRSR